MAATSAQAEKHASRLARYLPIVGWLPGYNHANLRPDVIAAVTVASFSVPESMAYAGLAGLPPEAGLYAGIAAPIAYAIFGTSRQLGIGATSALSILVASSIGALAANDAVNTPRWRRCWRCSSPQYPSSPGCCGWAS